MPKIEDNNMYNNVYEFLTNECFTTEIRKNLLDLIDILPAGTAVYRYVNYYNGPQDKNSTLKLRKPLKDDITNRWTGASADNPAIGSQGLYFSLDNPGELDTRFVELENYITTGSKDCQEITYQYWGPNKVLVKSSSTEEHLRTLFLFSLNDELKGINLKLSNKKAIEFLRWVLSMATTASFEETTEEIVINAYTNPTNASFCRAVGNGLEFFCRYIENISPITPEATLGCCLFVTSAHSQIAPLNTPAGDINKYESINIILRTKYLTAERTDPAAGDLLTAQGRITWFFVPPKAVYTDDDLNYNDTLSTEYLKKSNFNDQEQSKK